MLWRDRILIPATICPSHSSGMEFPSMLVGTGLENPAAVEAITRLDL